MRFPCRPLQLCRRFVAPLPLQLAITLYGLATGVFPIAAVALAPSTTTATCGKPVCTWDAFGPKSYARPAEQRGREDQDNDGVPTFTDSFSVQNTATKYTLHVVGNEHAHAVVFLNGKRVLDEDDFREHGSHKDGVDQTEQITVDRPLTLQLANSLKIRVLGKPGSSIVVSVIGVDNDPPVISAIANPSANSFGWNNTNVVITFTCSDATSGIASCPAPITLSAEGANQVVSGTATDRAGNAATVSLGLNIDKTPPQITAQVLPVPNAFGVVTAPATVTFTCTDAPSGVANCPSPVQVNTAGLNESFSGTATDKAGNSASTNITVSVELAPLAITASLTPAPNAAGWNNSPVTVNFQCSGGVPPVQCPAPQTAPADGANQAVSGTVTDAAGQTASAGVILNIARFPPTITASASPQPNAAGWNNSSVTVNFTCVATTAPIANCPPPQTVTTEGANQTVSGTVTDVAGNSASASATVKLDETPPVLSITSPANGASVATVQVSIAGSVSDALSGVSAVNCNSTTAALQGGTFNCLVALMPGANTIIVQATDVAGNATTQSESVTFVTGPTIAAFSPASAAVGTLITVTGSGFVTNGATPQVILSQQGGGTIPAPVASAGANSLTFVIPTSAATGPITVNVNGQSTVSATPLTVQAASSFALIASPASVVLLPGQTTTYQVSLASTNGFTQLAALNVSGLPAGVTATFLPPQITAGQSSLLTLSAPASQNMSSSQLTITASATVAGIPQTASATVAVNVQPAGGVAFAGRVAVTGDPHDTPLVGLTVRFTGRNYAGTQTGCTASTNTDSSGNFVFATLPDACSGSQLVQYDPSTVIAPPGAYSGVNLSYVLTAGQVTTPGIVVHLPRVDNAETVMVAQNSTTDQVLTFKSIPSLQMVVYAGTTLSLADGTQPNPFPLRVVEIPYEHLPEQVQPDPTQVPVFAMSIEPFNSRSSQPVAIYYPNRSNTAPGTDMPLTSLSPILGAMVNYGTGTVSPDGMQIIPDLDPALPGHAFGISSFDWFFFLPPAPNQVPPSPDPNTPKKGDPVDPFSGLLVVTKTDIAYGNARGQVAITRTYRSLSVSLGPFGRGTGFNYGYFIDTTALGNGFSMLTLSTPDGSQFPFAQQADGTFINSTIPSLAGAVISSPTNGIYSLRWKDGTTYAFEPSTGVATSTTFLTSITDTNGNKTTLGRNSIGELTQIIDPVGRTTNLTYDLDSQGHIGLITSITDPIGRTVQYTYDVAAGFAGCGTLTGVMDAAGGITAYSYDNQCQLVSITDARGITYLQNTYDGSGRVIKQIAADGGVTSFSYILLNPVVSRPLVCIDPNNCPISSVGFNPNVNTSPIVFTTVTDPLGNATTYHFNPQGFLLDETDALGQMTVYNRAAGTNQLLSFTDPLGRTTAFTYDNSGNATSITRLAGTQNAVTTNFAYDPGFNKVTNATDALGHTTALKYDPAGNLLSVTDPLGEQSAFSYDETGELTATVDPLGNTTRFAYTNGDLTATTDPLGRTTARVTDSDSRLIRITNPQGQSTQFQYDPLNQITQIIDPAGNPTTFNYDGNGNLLALTDALGHQTTYTFDSLDRLSTRTDPLGHSESYQYDQNGNLTQFTDRRGVVATNKYDPLNRRMLAQFASESSISYSYDAASRLTQATSSVTGPILRSYDALDRLVVEDTPQGSVSYGYDAAGRRTSMDVSGQSTVNYSYDNANRVKQINQGSSAVAFAYDADGRRTSLILPNGITMGYGYDQASQLRAINYTLGANTLGSLTYTYDLAGRRTAVGGSFARTNLPQAAGPAAYNTNNQLTQWKGANLTYDANGNLTSDGVSTYSWNARNQLVSISGPTAVTFQYDPFRRRVSKTNIGTTQYLYDGLNPVQELSGDTPSANLLAGGLDEYFIRTDTAGTRNFLTDALGSTLAFTDTAGTAQTSYTFGPFGNTTLNGANTTNSFAYTGRELDATGLYFYRARYYNPALQRFISEDPIGFSGGINTYAYADDDGVNFTDPLGTDKKLHQCIGQADQNFYTKLDDAANNNPAVLKALNDYAKLPDTFFQALVGGKIVGGSDSLLKATGALLAGAIYIPVKGLVLGIPQYIKETNQANSDYVSQVAACNQAYGGDN